MICHIGLGSNLGDRGANLQKAITEIAEKAGVFSAISSVYETEPWGFQSNNRFLNQVVCIDTHLSPSALLQECQDIEKTLGRNNKTQDHFEDRTIDIDLLLYEDLIIESRELTLPHPHLHTRMFVLQGLYEIAPDLIHPKLKQSISYLYDKLYFENTEQ